MSDFSLTLVLRFKTSKIAHDMAKVSIKSERITPFGGIFHVRELFSPLRRPRYRQSAGSAVYVLRLSVQRDCGFAVKRLLLRRGQHVIAPVVAGDSADGGQDGKISPNDY